MLAAFPDPEVLIIPFLAVINIRRGDTLDLVGEETNTALCHTCHHSADQKGKRRKDAAQRGGAECYFPIMYKAKMVALPSGLGSIFGLDHPMPRIQGASGSRPEV